MKLHIYKEVPWAVLLLTIAIALSPSFAVGQIDGGRIIEIRAQDILLVILGLLWIADFLISKRKKIEKPPLFLPILAWLGIGLFSLLINWILMNIALSRGFFYFLKEVQFFFLYFYIFYHLKNLKSTEFIIKTWIFLGSINILWILYQMISGRRFGDYGPGAIGEIGVYPSGGFFLILFIFLFNILLYHFVNLKISHFKKTLLIIVGICPALGVFASASKTNFVGITFAVILTLFLFFLKKKSRKTLMISILSLIFISALFVIAFKNVPDANRLLQSFDFSYGITTGRGEKIWKYRIDETIKSPTAFLFGFGKSVFLGGDESHSQYVRNFSETGIVGSVIFLILIYAILKKTWKGFAYGKKDLPIGLSAGAIIATCIMLVISLSGEAFIVVKISEIYWFFIALTMISLKIYDKSQNEQKILNYTRETKR